MIGNTFDLGLFKGFQWHLLPTIDESIVFVLVRTGVLELMFLFIRLRKRDGQLSNNHHVDILIHWEARLQKVFLSQ